MNSTLIDVSIINKILLCQLRFTEWQFSYIPNKLPHQIRFIIHVNGNIKTIVNTWIILLISFGSYMELFSLKFRQYIFCRNEMVKMCKTTIVH